MVSSSILPRAKTQSNAIMEAILELKDRSGSTIKSIEDYTQLEHARVLRSLQALLRNGKVTRNANGTRWKLDRNYISTLVKAQKARDAEKRRKQRQRQRAAKKKQTLRSRLQAQRKRALPKDAASVRQRARTQYTGYARDTYEALGDLTEWRARTVTVAKLRNAVMRRRQEGKVARKWTPASFKNALGKLASPGGSVNLDGTKVSFASMN